MGQVRSNGNKRKALACALACGFTIRGVDCRDEIIIVDHGTAFDIAGKNIADPRSMVEALNQAAEMASQHEPNHVG
ncbi:4-hydroxythreonine-4-phosphate dehydrogenase PdxA [Corynebacterium casei]|uniref:4-hydroxythreonine-4-phosphate dehydrogenase PdxA n=1 Tax=Corynebacterium casei TaxID=160386 RepID=UPI003F8E8748